MELKEAVMQRHSVRQYLDKKLPEEIVEKLKKEVAACNAGGYNIQLVTDEPNAFNSFLAHYGRFENVSNYIARVGKKSDDLYENLGYLGERLVIFAQSLGLNTCWVALTFSKRKAAITVNEGEKLVCVISLGYGKTQGTAHKNKPLEKFYTARADDPEWFKAGVEGALCAPTAVNQQKFFIERSGNEVNITATGGGNLGKTDLGIVKYDFETCAGKENFVWKK